jgi:arsenate reductase
MEKILFVCVHNAGRSQMAEALFNAVAAERGLAERAASAGTEPGERVHPEVVAAMGELGIDLSGRKPRRLSNEMVAGAERVITMGCAPDAESCPALFLKEVTDWALPDPRGESRERVRAIRDEIARRVRAPVEDIAGQRG